MKSNVRDLTDYCECVFRDAFAKCTTDIVNMDRDLTTVRRRSGHEGVSFLTITLPNFGQDFERSLEQGEVTSSQFSGWRRRKSLPAFLQGLTKLVFDVDTGRILDEPDITAVEGIRQIAFTFKKLSIPCSPERERRALSGYKEIEHTLSSPMLLGDADLFCSISACLWNDVFVEDYDSLRYVPKHGPGQTAERVSGNRKYAQRTWTERLEPFFPADAYLMSCYTQLDDDTDGIRDVQFTRQDEELPVKVTLVPKTLKGPRIIAMEPVCMQYAQQALSRYVVALIERHRITRGHVNFTDQSVNRCLAVSGSQTGRLATLDLSSASDRVPLSLVRLMLQSLPDFLGAVEACRSGSAQLPDGEIIPLRKFASMGSALCFPIEAMYFFSVILVALFRETGLPVTSRNIFKLSREVYVYGDDIIVPVEQVEAVVKALTDFGCKVNANKSFWKGSFRESCGMDAFRGECVTPTYLRELRPDNRGDASRIISWVETCNLLYKRGYWITAAHMKSCVESILGKLPIVGENSPALGWTSFQRFVTYDRWNRKLHRFEVHAYVPCPTYKRDELGGWSALLKFFLNAACRDSNAMEAVDEEHLNRSPRSGTSCIKRRWTTPY